MSCGRVPLEISIVRCRPQKTAAVFVALSVLFVAGRGRAQSDRPRFVILLDDSGSMTQNPAGVSTHGDGSQSQPGCDLDGKSSAGWAYDDSKLYLAKSAVIDTISAFGAAEFALATYSMTLLGQACTTNADCTARVAGSACLSVPGATQKVCAYQDVADYLECPDGTGSGCVKCANPTDTNDFVFDWGSFDCTNGKTCSFPSCIGGQVVVGFPAAGASNLWDIYHWIDGVEDVPPFTASSNRELRAVTQTPLGSALDSIRAWLTDASPTAVGPGAGLLSTSSTARDPRASCRPYSIILVTDGEDTCSPNPVTDPVTAAGAAYRAGVNVYVVGFGTGYSAVLNNMAMAGSGQSRTAYFPSNRSDLAASLGDILMNAIPKPKCNCDATCYDEAAAFPLKGQACTVGIGRCKRQGVYACNTAGDGVVCANAATCGATPLVAGTPVTEQCGILPGCLAPTPADCADENCNGLIDEGLSCACASQPEVCNGKDDNCDGIIDNIAQVPCGLDLGACKPGVTVCGPDNTVVCKGEIGPTPEVCDGIDNDCDGIVDQFARTCYLDGQTGCTYDATANTWTCVGGCKTGLQICSAGTWQACAGAVTPVAEIACDGIDNNCDGRVDENDPSAQDTCYPPATVGCDATTGKCIGQCALGHLACAANKMGTTCVGATTPIAEMCNGKDDDCDGQIDEDFPTLGQACNQASCQGAGVFVCNKAGTDVECTVSGLGPTPEICDGIDNDCDGLIDEAPSPGEPPMPGVGIACGSDIGECKAGVTTCTSGKIVCNAVGPTPEICDGKDNNCNGSIDEGLVPPATSCNPDGIASGQPLLGECRAGTFVCEGSAGWKCEGGVGPTPEICDGKDNNCDGQIDNGAICLAGLVCVGGECIPTCAEGGEQYPCPADRYCKNGACLIRACALHPCAAGLVCQADGTCVDPCSQVTCLPGATCVKGICLDCYSQGCPAGKVCIDRQCQTDPCAGVTCVEKQFCNDGVCTPSCAGVTCDVGQVCAQGACHAAACSQACESNLFCDTATGQCEPKHCVGVACPVGQTCVNTTGRCTDNPCEKVHCGTGKICVVADDGIPDCAIPAVNGIASQASTTGNGVFGCSCGVAGGRPGSRAGFVSLFAVAMAVALRRRQRR
jgi:MYXO-CTERM domain-containing protein